MVYSRLRPPSCNMVFNTMQGHYQSTSFYGRFCNKCKCLTFRTKNKQPLKHRPWHKKHLFIPWSNSYFLQSHSFIYSLWIIWFFLVTLNVKRSVRVTVLRVIRGILKAVIKVKISNNSFPVSCSIRLRSSVR